VQTLCEHGGWGRDEILGGLWLVEMGGEKEKKKKKIWQVISGGYLGGEGGKYPKIIINWFRSVGGLSCVCVCVWYCRNMV